jgi:hypothetical protein
MSYYDDEEMIIMEKVKVFAEENAYSLEIAINEFITSDEVNKLIDIKYSTNVIPVPDRHGIVDPVALFSALVIYEKDSRTM